jgi:hypothetical protein
MGYGFLLENGGLDLGRWGAGSPSAGFEAGNLGMRFCIGNLRGMGLNESKWVIFTSSVSIRGMFCGHFFFL